MSLQRGLVHGSLKPTNILVAENGQASIADCGMIHIKPSGSICPQRYFSPEAWKGVCIVKQHIFAMPNIVIFLYRPFLSLRMFLHLR